MTALFLCFGIYLMGYKKTILRETDTFNQQYITFIKIGQWIREMIRERRVLVWDPSIGYGADFFLTLSTSNQGSIFDPFMLVSVFTPPRYSEIIFTAIVFLRLYLCGITFSLLAFRKKVKIMPRFAARWCIHFPPVPMWDYIRLLLSCPCICFR